MDFEAQRAIKGIEKGNDSFKAGVAAFFAVMMIVAAFSEGTSTDQIIGMSVFFGVVGGLLCSYFLLRNPLKGRFYRTLLKKPQNVVWIYPVQNRKLITNQHIDTEVTVCTTNGRRLTRTFDPKHEARALEHIHRLCPHAAYGYSDQLAHLYRYNPAGFLHNLHHQQA